MYTGTINFGDLARERDILIRTFQGGLLFAGSGIKDLIGDDPDYCPVDDCRDLENTAPEEEPDPCPRR